MRGAKFLPTFSVSETEVRRKDPATEAVVARLWSLIVQETASLIPGSIRDYRAAFSGRLQCKRSILQLDPRRDFVRATIYGYDNYFMHLILVTALTHPES
jgi:hypothetical protein